MATCTGHLPAFYHLVVTGKWSDSAIQRMPQANEALIVEETRTVASPEVRKRGLVMKARMLISACVLLVIVGLALTPAMGLAAPKTVQLPSWVTDVINQVKAVAQDAAAQIKPIVNQARADIRQVITDTLAAMKGVTDPVAIKALMARAKAEIKAIVDQAKAEIAPIVQAAAAQIKTIIQNAKAQAAGLPASVKAKVLNLLNGLKKCVPAFPKL